MGGSNDPHSPAGVQWSIYSIRFHSVRSSLVHGEEPQCFDAHREGLDDEPSPDGLCPERGVEEEVPGEVVCES
jgi:hypothetical protein